MYGSKTAAAPTAIPNAAASSSSVGNTPAGLGGIASKGMPQDNHLIATILVFLGLWVVWAVVQQRQKVKDQVQPANIALNLHNLLTFVLTGLVAFGLFKVLMAKMVGWGVPGSKALAAWANFAL